MVASPSHHANRIAARADGVSGAVRRVHMECRQLPWWLVHKLQSELWGLRRGKSQVQLRHLLSLILTHSEWFCWKLRSRSHNLWFQGRVRRPAVSLWGQHRPHWERIWYVGGHVWHAKRTRVRDGHWSLQHPSSWISTEGDSCCFRYLFCCT